MKTLGVIANCTKPRAADVLRRLAAKASELGLSLLTDRDASALMHAGAVVSPPEMFDGVEAIMALGGDGTMLRAVRALDGRDLPVIGVNIGGLGFLTSVAEGEMDRALECLASDDYEVSLRSMAEGEVERDGVRHAGYRALNEVLVGQGPASRVVTLDVWIDGDYLTSYVCDGLIVSTPTGSTGHALSSGGPIVLPDTRAFVVSLVCPHTLSSRPLVIPDSSTLLVRVTDGTPGLLLTVDGQVGEALKRGDRVGIRRSERGVRFIHLPGHSYFAVLRQKLHWSGKSI